MIPESPSHAWDNEPDRPGPSGCFGILLACMFGIVLIIIAIGIAHYV